MRFTLARRPCSSRTSARVGVGVVLAVEHHVLEGDALAARERHVAARREQRRQRIAPVDRHEALALASVVACSDTARFTRVSAMKRGISGASPTVDTVIRRGEIAWPHSAVRFSTAATTARSSRAARPCP